MPVVFLCLNNPLTAPPAYAKLPPILTALCFERVFFDAQIMIAGVLMRTVEWHEGKVRMIDQRVLPWDLALLDYEDYHEVARAITDMVVRGAPAIGAAAAFGMALAAMQAPTTDR